MSGGRVGGRALAAVATIAAVGLTAPAYAAWTGSGAGNGSATADTTSSLVLSPASPSATLFPGGSADVVLTVTNPNIARVRVGSLSLDTSQGTGGYSVDAAHSGCSVSALGFSTQTNSGAGWTIDGRVGSVNGTLAVTLTNALSMTLNAANACQGATMTVYLTAGP